MQLAAPVLAEEVPRPPVLLVVLQRDQRVEHVEDLAADRADLRRRNDEDEVVATDVPDEPARTEQPLHDVVQDPGQQVDDPVAVVVAVAVVELLEVVEVGVADGELLAGLQPAADLALDLGGARQPGGGMDRDVALGADQHRVEPRPLLRRREDAGDDLVGPGRKPVLDLLRMVVRRQHRHRDDRGERVALEPPDQVDAIGAPIRSPSTNRRQGWPRRTIDSTSSGWLNPSSGKAFVSAHCRTRAGTGHASGEKKRIVGRVRTHCLS